MAFRAGGRCGQGCAEIIAAGVIDADSADGFRAALTAAGASRAVVYLASPGGNLLGGVHLGSALREANATVVVRANTRCVSACVYALLGGAVRRVEPGGQVGIHRFHADEAVPRVLAEYTIKMLTDFTGRMGADAGLVSLADGVAPQTVRYLSADELRRYRIVTERMR